MACCGKAIKNTLSKAVSIAKGHSLRIVKEIFKLPDEQFPLYRQRLRECRTCNMATWLTWSEYLHWINENISTDELPQLLLILEEKPDLPDGTFNKNKHLFCKRCKCHLPAKAMDNKSKCPLNSWTV